MAELHGVGREDVDLFGISDARLPDEWPANVHLWRLALTLADGGGSPR